MRVGTGVSPADHALRPLGTSCPAHLSPRLAHRPVPPTPLPSLVRSVSEESRLLGCDGVRGALWLRYLYLSIHTAVRLKWELDRSHLQVPSCPTVWSHHSIWHYVSVATDGKVSQHVFLGPRVFYELFICCVERYTSEEKTISGPFDLYSFGNNVLQSA